MFSQATNKLHIIAPGVIEQPCNEAEVLGSVVWLWMHSASHRDMPLHTLPTLLLPAIKHRQFVLASIDGWPVGYLAWANLSEEAETRYLQQHPLLMPQADWNCGDRLWLLDWIAPFGHSRVFSDFLRRQLFANRCGRALDHRGNQRGLRIKNYHGRAIPPQEAKAWLASHPVVFPSTSQEKETP